MALNLAFLLCPILAEAKPWYDILKKQHSNSIHKYSNINITTSPSKISELGTKNLWILSISEYLEATLHGSFWNLQLVLFYKHHLYMSNDVQREAMKNVGFLGGKPKKLKSLKTGDTFQNGLIHRGEH